jgi:hypothetical protein
MQTVQQAIARAAMDLNCIDTCELTELDREYFKNARKHLNSAIQAIHAGDGLNCYIKEGEDGVHS